MNIAKTLTSILIFGFLLINVQKSFAISTNSSLTSDFETLDKSETHAKRLISLLTKKIKDKINKTINRLKQDIDWLRIAGITKWISGGFILLGFIFLALTAAFEDNPSTVQSLAIAWLICLLLGGIFALIAFLSFAIYLVGKLSD